MFLKHSSCKPLKNRFVIAKSGCCILLLITADKLHSTFGVVEDAGFEDTSIKDFIGFAINYFLVKQQEFSWRKRDNYG